MGGRLAAIALVAFAQVGCPGGAATGAPPSSQDSGRDTPPPGDDTARSDTANSSEPNPRDCDGQPSPRAIPLVVVPSPCGNIVSDVVFIPGVPQVVISERAGCETGTGGIITALDAATGETRWRRRYPEASDGGYAWIYGSRDGSDLTALLADGDDRRELRAVDVIDSAGAAVARVSAVEHGVAGMFAVSEASLAVSVLRPYGDGRGALAVFASPLPRFAEWTRADAVHSQPPGTCCDFGARVMDVGDPTGDGLRDLLVLGGGAWLLSGDLVATSEGILAAPSVDIVGYERSETVGPVGDFTGDGLDDFSTSTDGIVEIVAGGTLEGAVQFRSRDYDQRPGNSVVPVGTVGANDASTIVLSGGDHPMGDHYWLVTGPLCGREYVEDAGERIGAPGDPAEFYSLDGADGFIFGKGFNDGEVVKARVATD